MIFGGRNPRSTAGCHHGGFPEHHNGRCPSPLLSPGRWVPRGGGVEEEQGHLPLWWGPRSPPSHRAGPPAAGEKDRELGTLGTTAPLGGHPRATLGFPPPHFPIPWGPCKRVRLLCASYRAPGFIHWERKPPADPSGVGYVPTRLCWLPYSPELPGLCLPGREGRKSRLSSFSKP